MERVPFCTAPPPGRWWQKLLTVPAPDANVDEADFLNPAPGILTTFGNSSLPIADPSGGPTFLTS